MSINQAVANQRDRRNLTPDELARLVVGGGRAVQGWAAVEEISAN
jgi:hypothetical protein